MNRIAIAAVLVVIGFWAGRLAFWVARAPDEGAARPQVVAATGTVVHPDIEGGFWGITGADGKQYDPHDSLPEKFRQVGLRVTFKANLVPDAVCYHMWGTIVTITEIDLLKDPQGEQHPGAS